MLAYQILITGILNRQLVLLVAISVTRYNCIDCWENLLSYLPFYVNLNYSLWYYKMSIEKIVQRVEKKVTSPFLNVYKIKIHVSERILKIKTVFST